MSPVRTTRPGTGGRRGTLRAAVAVAALALLSSPQLGFSCGGGGGGGGGGAPPPQIVVYLEPGDFWASVGDRVVVDVVMDSGSDPLPRAWDLTFATDASRLQINSAAPHPEYDDDGQLFLDQVSSEGAKTVRRIVDLKTTGTSQLGTVRVATLELEVLSAGPPIAVEVSSDGASTGAGIAFDVVPIDATVRVPSP